MDKLLLNTPVAALEAARTELIRGINILQEMLRDTMHMVYRRDEKKMAAIIDNEDTINYMQKDLTKYVVELSRKKLTKGQSMMVPAIINSMNNIERSGDRIMEICTLYNKKKDANLAFSDTAVSELKDLEKEIMNL